MKSVPMSEIRAAATGKFFCRSNMRDFKTKLTRNGYQAHAGGYWFLTGDGSKHGPCLWSIRFMMPEGDVATVGEYRGYLSAELAREQLKAWAALPLPPRFWRLFNIIRHCVSHQEPENLSHWCGDAGVEVLWPHGEAPILNELIQWADHF